MGSKRSSLFVSCCKLILICFFVFFERNFLWYFLIASSHFWWFESLISQRGGSYLLFTSICILVIFGSFCFCFFNDTRLRQNQTHLHLIQSLKPPTRPNAVLDKTPNSPGKTLAILIPNFRKKWRVKKKKVSDFGITREMGGDCRVGGCQGGLRENYTSLQFERKLGFGLIFKRSRSPPDIQEWNWTDFRRQPWALKQWPTGNLVSTLHTSQLLGNRGL